MISSVITVCADTVVVDKLSNAISIINIFEQIRLERFPVVIPRMWLFFELARDSGDPEQVLTTVTLTIGQTELVHADNNFDFQGALRSRSVLQLQNLIIPGPGIVRAAVDVGGEIKGFWDISCETVPSPQITLPFEQDQRVDQNSSPAGFNPM